MRKQYLHLLFAVAAFLCVCSLSPLTAQENESANQADSVAPLNQDAPIPEQQEETEAIAATEAHDALEAASEEHHEGGGHESQVTLFGVNYGETGQFYLKLINFLIFGGLMFWLLKGVLSSAFRARTTEIEAKLAQSESDRAEGEAQLRELETKMAGLHEELDGIMAKAEAEASAEKQRIIEAAKAEAGQILAQVQSEIEYQKRLAEIELRELVAKLAVESAEQRIQRQVQGDTVSWIMDQAIARIGGAD
jgi:F-type H+-transporting ATPase subunit b